VGASSFFSLFLGLQQQLHKDNDSIALFAFTLVAFTLVAFTLVAFALVAFTLVGAKLGDAGPKIGLDSGLIIFL